MLAATRSDALAQLTEFIPASGRYSSRRNHIVSGHANVSQLSPAIRHRLVTEWEVAAAPLERYAPSTVEKFTQEVYWRRYWKSWLSLRPQVWDDYLARLAHILESPNFAVERERAAAAERGESGLEVMDIFARELVETGYLHNHARMWFAAWWVHTERLPWELGADFFYRHLLDGDPASNTLSWRWVAGLQTPGKTYLARKSNLEKYLEYPLTAEQWAQLDILAKPEAVKLPLPKKPAVTRPELVDDEIDPTLPTGIWVHEDDLHPESSLLAQITAESTLITYDECSWSAQRFSPLVQEWKTTALDDTTDRLRLSSGQVATSRLPLPQALTEWARNAGLKQAVALRPEVGPLHDQLETLRTTLADAGVSLALISRPEDATLRPLATAGFFGFWKKVQKQNPTAKPADLLTGLL